MITTDTQTQTGHPRNTASCGCDGTGQVWRNASDDPNAVNALSYVTRCRDVDCARRRDAAFMGVSDEDIERYF